MVADRADAFYCIGVLEQTLIEIKNNVDDDYINHDILQRTLKSTSELCSKHYIVLNRLEEVIER
jgi:hypothetical protein